MLIHNQVRWVGHVVRMDDDRLPKQLFYGELEVGSKPPQHKPKKSYKDCVKDNLKALHIDVNSWEEKTMNRAAWRKAIREGCSNFECQRLEHVRLKRDLRKGTKSNPPTNLRT